VLGRRRSMTPLVSTTVVLLAVVGCTTDPTVTVGPGPTTSTGEGTSVVTTTTTASTRPPTTVAETTTTTRRPPSTPRPTVTSLATTTSTTASHVIEPGTYLVGKELPAGTYRVEQYWARLDANQEIIDNDVVDKGLTVVNVQPTDVYIKFDGQALAIVNSKPIDPAANGYTDGTYLVGYDLQPGRYRIAKAQGAYFARLDAKGEIVDNDLNDGSVIAVVRPTDWALKFDGTIQRLG
jgi:hypothetical protein